MIKLKALIVDDELAALNGLTQLLGMYCPEVDVTGCAQSMEEAIRLLSESDHDIIFLDVQLGDKSGFGLMELATAKNCSVVFVTAHSEYAAHAFRTDALDYLLKPVFFKDLQDAVTRTILRRQKKQPEGMRTEHKVRIGTSAGIQFIPSKDIVCIHGEGKYSTIYTSDRKEHFTSRNIGAYEDELSGHGFFRVNKSWLINCVHVVRILTVDGGTVELTNGKTALLSRRKKHEFMKRMEG